jgi:hypothetical protein
MRKFAWVAILPWFAAACSSAAVNGQDNPGDQGRSPGGADAATDSNSTVSDASNVMSEAGSRDASSRSPDAAPLPRACDSGGPLALKSVWNLPAVAPSGAAVDGKGNVYVTGQYTGTVTFGTTTLTGPTTAGSGDMFLVKYDGSGNVLFANSYGSMTGVYDPPVIAVDPQGDVFLGGAFSLELDFGGGTTPLVAIALDAFTAKISPTGQALWADHFGYDGGPYAVLSIALGPDGDPVVGGTANGTIILGDTSWPAPVMVGGQPFIAKLNTADGSVLWSNATGGDISSGEDIFVAVDASERVFVAARMGAVGGGAWGVVPDVPDASTGGTLLAGFDSNGKILWGQFEAGIPMGAAIDQAGRFSVLENIYGAVVDGTTPFGNSASSFSTLALLTSPTDGTVLSGYYIPGAFPWASTVDANGNTLVTANSGSGEDAPLLVAAADGLSRGVGSVTMGANSGIQPLAIAVDPGSGNIFVPGTVSTAFTSSVGAVPAGTFVAVFGPDPCDDGAGPIGSSTGTTGNHGDLLPDGGSPYVANDGATPAACPADPSNAINGAACPVAMGCTYGDSCCICTPTACNGEPTTWTCDVVQNTDPSCPSSPPAPGTPCPTYTPPGSQTQCDYCLPEGRLDAVCTIGGWETVYAQLLCE